MASFIFFLSGASALVFETIFFHLAGLVLGNSLSGAVTVLTSFMLGMAAGNGLAARNAGRIRRPAATYAAAEALVALSGVLLTALVLAGSASLAPFFRLVAPHPALLDPSRAALALVALLIPATAMGVTLPVMAAATHERGAAFGVTLGRLYGWNTLGAVVGVLAGETLLVRHFGIMGAAVGAAALSLTAAALALRLPEPAAGEAGPVAARGLKPASSGAMPGAVLPLAAAFVTGLCLMALEVVWFRFLLLFFFPTALNFAVMLAAVLLGIGAGGLAAASRYRRGQDPADRLVPSLLFAGALVLLCYRLFLPAVIVGSLFGPFILLSTLVLVFPVSFLSGFIFTVLGHLLHGNAGREAQTAGRLSMANTLGAAAGPVLARFALLPFLGIEGSFVLAALVYGGLAFVFLAARFAARDTREAGRERLGPIKPLAAAGVVFLFAILVSPGGMKTYLDLSISSFTPWGERRTSYRETPADSLQILQRDLLGQPLQHRLVTNSFSMATTGLWGRRYMKLFVYLPVALHPRPEKALLLCYGLGSTARALADTPSLKSIDVVELSRGVLEASREMRGSPGGNPLDDPRVTVHVEDARFFLQSTAQRFDLITGEPPPPKASKVVNLYSREFFALARDRLAPGGIFTYWMPIDQLRADEAKAVIRAFRDVFEDASLWCGTDTQWMMMGSRGPDAPPPSREDFSRQWSDSAVGPEMRALGFPGPEALGSLYLADGPRLKAWLGKTPPLTDNRPWRLAPWGPPGEKDYAVYRELSNADLSSRDFLEGAGISGRWPEDLRAATAGQFTVRQAVNDLERPTPELLRMSLDRPLLRPYLSWALGSDADAQRILAAAGPAALPGDGGDPELLLHLAAREAMRGDYAAAAAFLDRAAGAEATPGVGRRLKPAQLREMRDILLERARAQRP